MKGEKDVRLAEAGGDETCGQAVAQVGPTRGAALPGIFDFAVRVH